MVILKLELKISLKRKDEQEKEKMSKSVKVSPLGKEFLACESVDCKSQTANDPVLSLAQISTGGAHEPLGWISKFQAGYSLTNFHRCSFAAKPLRA